MTSHYSSEHVSKFVELILIQSIKDNASDILFYPISEGYKICSKIDGEVKINTNTLATGTKETVSFVKELAGLDPKNIYTPQDGSFIYEGYQGELTKLRVATLPTAKGEQITIRVIRNFQHD